MKNEAHGVTNESLEGYKQQLTAWGQEFVNRAIEADLSGEDCEKIERFVAAAVEAGVHAFSGETLPWTQPIFERVVEKLARSLSSADADLVRKVLSSREIITPFVTQEEAATIPTTHVPPIEIAASTEESIPVSTTAPVRMEHVFHGFDQSKWSNIENSPEETYHKYSENVQRITEKKIAELSIGATPEEQQTIRQVIESLRDHVVDAARSEGPIPFEQRLKYDATVRMLSVRRTAAASRIPVASAQDTVMGEEKKEPIKSFADISALREVLSVVHEEEQEARAVTEHAPAQIHRSATHEPPETIIGVSAELPVTAPGEQSVLMSEGVEEHAGVERLNALKELIDTEHELIRTTREENKRDALSGKKITDARRRLGALHQEAKEIAAHLVDPLELFALVKPADDAASRLYESQIPRKTAKDERRKMESTLPENDVHAYYEAVRRKNAFADMLGQKGVEKNIAYDLYREFTHQAQELDILKDVLERGEERGEGVLSTSRAQKVLEWHGIVAREPQAVLAALTPLVGLYHTIPQKAERAAKNVPQEKRTPMAVLSELLLSGKEDITLVPRSMLQQLAVGENETVKNIAEEELIRLEAQEVGRAKNAVTEVAPEAAGAALNTERDAQLVELLRSGTEDISLVPRSKLRQLVTNEDSVIREMAEKELSKLEESLRADAETAVPENNALVSSALPAQSHAVVAPIQRRSNTDGRLSGRQMEDLIESTAETSSWRNAPTTAETSFEIKQGRAMNKAAIGRGPSLTSALSPEVVETTPETRELLKAKATLVGEALALFFGKTGQTQGGHLTESGVTQLRDALVACNYRQLDEARLSGGDSVYLAELEEWLRTQYNDVLVPAMEKPESLNASIVAPASQVAEADNVVSIDALLLSEEAVAQTRAPEKFLPIDHDVTKQFGEKFGIAEGVLEDIPGFRGLSSGQQFLVLKNLEQIAFTDIEKEASAQQKAEWVALPAWRRIWKQSYSAGMNPEQRTAELQKELLTKYRQSLGAGDPEGRAKILASQLAHLEQLVKVAAEGPEVKVKVDGTLEVLYVAAEGVSYTLEQQKLVAEFNSVASLFAQFPREWGYETEKAGIVERWGDDRRRYEATKARYVLARASVLQLYRDKCVEEIAVDGARSGEDPAQIAMQYMNEIDERVQLNQLFINHPDAEAALQQAEDQNTIMAAAKEFWKSKGMFIAGGALVRGATIAVSGGIMLPVVGVIGGIVGAGIGAAEGEKLMKEKRADGRMSEEDLREEIVATNVTTGEAIVGADGKPMKRQIREFTDATLFVDRIDRLTEKLEDTTEPQQRTLLEKKIAQTVALMNEKLERGMINFGGSSLEAGNERKGGTIANRLSFIQAMAKGRLATVVDQAAIEEKIERITGLRQVTIEDKRKTEIKKIAAKSAFIRGTFALTGAGIVQGVKELMHFGEPGFLGATTAQAPRGVAEALPDAAHPPVTAAEVAPDAASPDDFTAAHFNKNIAAVVGRTPSVQELIALRSTGGVDSPATANMDQHNALIGAISASRTPLSHEQIEAVMSGSTATSNGGGALPSPLDSVASERSGVVALEYHVQSGDKLTRIMQHLDALKDVPPEQQENIIQNFIRSLSDAEKTAIGITDLNNMPVDQTIHLDKLNELLLQKQVDGENLIAHAQQLGGETATTTSTVEVSPEGGLLPVLESTSTSLQAGVPTNIAEFDPSQRISLWSEISDAHKHAYIAEAAPRHIAEDMSKLFAKGPFEEWPKEWASLRGRFVDDLLLQTEKTDPHTLLPRGTEEVPPGYEWSAVRKIQQYVADHGLTPEKGFVPHKHETLEEFLSRGLSERILRDGPLPWLKS